VDLADLPYAPVLTASAVKLVLGLVLGLLLDSCWPTSSSAQHLDRRPEDLEAVLHLPGLRDPRITSGSSEGRSRFAGCWAAASRGWSRSPMSGTQTFSIGIEAFRNLRTSLIWSDGGEALKTLVVTSASRGRGEDAHCRRTSP